MKKVRILVEGQTEETFVRDVLYPHLFSKSKTIESTIVVTKRVKSGGSFKGGVSSYGQVKRDLLRLLGDSSADTVTTMFDYYALPSDFPGHGAAPTGSTAEAKAKHIEQAFAEDVKDARFIPYLSLHEFESLLFVDPASAQWIYDSAHIVTALEDVRDEFQKKPETINDGPSTAPSKRVIGVFPKYEKPLHGPMATGAAGLTALRGLCPHFDAWLSALES
jgi:hypothetical protein